MPPKSARKQQYQQQKSNTPRGCGRPRKTPQVKPPLSTGRRPKIFNINTGESIVTHGNYTGLKPHLYLVKTKDKNSEDVPDYKQIFTIQEEDKFLLEFHVGIADVFDLDEEPIPNPALFSDLILPDHFIDEIVHRSNCHIEWRLGQHDTLFDDAGKPIIHPKTGLRKKNPNFLLEDIAKRNPEIQRSGKQMFMIFVTAAPYLYFFPYFYCII